MKKAMSKKEFGITEDMANYMKNQIYEAMDNDEEFQNELYQTFLAEFILEYQDKFNGNQFKILEQIAKDKNENNMNERDFCYWLQGFFEVSNSETLTKEQVLMIKEHLQLVFYNVTKPFSETASKCEIGRSC
jgi:hypothetical protein